MEESPQLKHLEGILRSMLSEDPTRRPTPISVLNDPSLKINTVGSDQIKILFKNLLRFNVRISHSDKGKTAVNSVDVRQHHAQQQKGEVSVPERVLHSGHKPGWQDIILGVVRGADELVRHKPAGGGGADHPDLQEPGQKQ